MGLTLARLWDNWAGGLESGKECGMLMVGLDAAGKTTILYRLKLGEVKRTTPTIGFNVESVQYKNVKFNVWDVGGQSKIRPLWKHYYKGVGGVIFVVDSADKARLKEAKDELMYMLKDDLLRDVLVLVFLNKQDMDEAMKPSQIVEEIGLSKVNQTWYAQPCCALKGEGLFEGLDWLSAKLRERA